MNHAEIGNVAVALSVYVAVKLSYSHNLVEHYLAVCAGSHDVGNYPKLRVKLFDTITVVSVAETAFAFRFFCK